MLYGLGFESHRRYNFFSILNYLCDIVKRFTFAISHLLMSACVIISANFFCYFRFRFFPVLLSLCMSVFSGISPKVVGEFSRNFGKELALYKCMYFLLRHRYGCEILRSVWLYVCLSVCPSAYLKTACPNCKTFSAHVTCGRRSVLF